MRKRFYLGFQFSLFQDRQGLKVSLKVKLLKPYFERTWFLRRNKNWGKGNPELTPKLPCPEMLAKVHRGKQLQPEDM